MLIEDGDIGLQVTCIAWQLVVSRYSDANSKASNLCRTRAGAVVGTVVSTLRQVPFTALELVLLHVQ